MKPWHRSIPPLILTGSLLGFYLRTIAPGLTWANGGSDGGDLITAAATGGIAHPTGYPLYLILARLFQFLPVGSLPFRTNLMSAVFTLLAALLVYAIVTRAFSTSDSLQVMLAGMCAGYCFGLAPLIWSQAVITEVYALQASLFLLILYLYTYPEPSSKSMDRWRGLVLGLAMGNHLTTVLIIPVALMLGSVHKSGITNPERSEPGKVWFDGASLKRQLAGFALGLCVHLTIPIRALAQPPINWGDPVTLERFWWLVSGGVYQSYYLQAGMPDLWMQIKSWAVFLIHQISILGTMIGLVGLSMFSKFSRLSILTAWAAFASLVFVLFYRSADAYVYMIPVLISFSIWIGLGMGELVNLTPQHYSLTGLGISLLLLSYFFIRPITYWHQVDASLDHRAETFGREVLTRVPANAILFAKGDRALFTLWYFHFALGERADVSLLATELLPFDWYQDVLRSIYPNLSMPESFVYPETIAGANPSRATCRVQFTDRAEIECAEPLEAP